MSHMVAVVVTPDGESIGGGLGKATHLAVATVSAGTVTDWQVHAVGWDVLHDVGEHGSHHARIVRFMRDNGVERVVAAHIGAPMQNTLRKLGLAFTMDVSGDARSAVLTAAGA